MESITANNWERIHSAMANNETVEGYVMYSTKGGIIINLYDINAFLPEWELEDIHSDRKGANRYDDYRGKTLQLKIKSIDDETRRVVVTLTTTVQTSKIHGQNSHLVKFHEKQILKGTVTGITNFGAFVNLGDACGLIHISNLSWDAIEHPSKVVSVGDIIDVIILKIDYNTNRIILGLKQLKPSTWDNNIVNYKLGDIVKGRIYRISNKGIRVEIAPSIIGDIPKRELSWTQPYSLAKDAYGIGDEIECVVKSIDYDNHKILLSTKELTDPWINLDPTLSVGDTVKVKVLRTAEFGIFVELIPGVTGFIHYSEIAWIKPTPYATDIAKIDSTIDCVITRLDRESHTLAFSLKRTTNDPWDHIEQHYNVGDRVRGKIMVRSNIGTWVQLEDGVVAFLHNSMINYYDSCHTSCAILNVGDEIECTIAEIDREGQKFNLSCREIAPNPWEEIFKSQTIAKKLTLHLREVFNIRPISTFSPKFAIISRDKDLELESIVIPSSVMAIGNAAFHKCSNLREVTIPTSVVYINLKAFADCTSLSHITIPSSVRKIGSRAFKGCVALTSVTLPLGVEIAPDAFDNCPALQHIHIPAGMSDYYKLHLPETLHRYIVELQAA